MIEAVAPKITDISSIKGISALLALPMLCIAYFLQSGASITWDGSVWLSLGVGLPTQTQLYRLILIFLLKSMWISFFGALIYGVISYVYINVDFPVIQLSSAMMIAFALFGMFCSKQFTQLNLIDQFWFCSLIVWGVFLQTMKEQLDVEREKLVALVRERVKANELS